MGNIRNISHFFVYLLERCCKIDELRSGGQSGTDEAGIVAGIRLGINSICLFPKGYRFRDINNKDIKDEKAFKLRLEWQA